MVHLESTGIKFGIPFADGTKSFRSVGVIHGRVQRLKGQRDLNLQSLFDPVFGAGGGTFVRSPQSCCEIGQHFFVLPTSCNLLSSIENWKITYALFAQRAIISTRYGLAALKLTEQTFLGQLFFSLDKFGALCLRLGHCI